MASGADRFRAEPKQKSAINCRRAVRTTLDARSSRAISEDFYFYAVWAEPCPDADGADGAAGCADTSTGIGGGACGITSQATKYPSTAGISGNGKRISTTQIRRTMVESTSRYSAMPPQTPPSLESVEERIRRFCGRGAALGALFCLAPQ